ncbi:MAG: hypothetical protein HY913_22790 [Desulfomonile tiedjei]|nr:hypothetical protein [Desulfomonile tiedjei]
METDERYDHILIRDATILVRFPKGGEGPAAASEFFDVRTGVQIRAIHPSLQKVELDRGFLLSDEAAGAILRSGAPILSDPSADLSKVVTILEVKQRKLDSIVADSILDQLRVITALLQHILDAANTAQKEERFWLAQQVLTLVRKFSGRELSEMEEIVDWFKTRHKK